MGSVKYRRARPKVTRVEIFFFFKSKCSSIQYFGTDFFLEVAYFRIQNSFFYVLFLNCEALHFAFLSNKCFTL